MSPAALTVEMRGEGTRVPPASCAAPGSVWGLPGLGLMPPSALQLCHRRKQAVPKVNFLRLGDAPLGESEDPPLSFLKWKKFCFEAVTSAGTVQRLCS